MSLRAARSARLCAIFLFLPAGILPAAVFLDYSTASLQDSTTTWSNLAFTTTAGRIASLPRGATLLSAYLSVTRNQICVVGQCGDATLQTWSAYPAITSTLVAANLPETFSMAGAGSVAFPADPDILQLGQPFAAAILRGESFEVSGSTGISLHLPDPESWNQVYALPVSRDLAFRLDIYYDLADRPGGGNAAHNPEPATWLLTGLGLAGAATCRARKR